MNRHHWNTILGSACVVFALVTLLIWIPNGVESGVIEQVRSQTAVGDAMAPTVWAIGLGFIGIFLIVESLLKLRAGTLEAGGNTGGPTLANLRFLGLLLVVVFGSLLVMSWAGPFVVKLAQAMGSDIGSYRELRATRPWKYTGYLSGGFLLVFGLMGYVAGRPSWRLALVALLAVLLMALAYDLPFKNLLLPPNGDQ